MVGCIVLRTREGSLTGDIDNGQKAHNPPQPGMRRDEDSDEMILTLFVVTAHGRYP